MTYYPIGTVVTLKGGNHPIMIYGRKQVQTDTNLIWDYAACLYPEGNISDDYIIFFQQEEVETVNFTGFRGELEERMQGILNGI